MERKIVKERNSYEIYEGETLNGLRDGCGTCYYYDGGIYVGEWKLGLKHGVGIYFYKDGDKLIAEYKQGKPNGEFIIHKNTGAAFKAEWLNGELIIKEKINLPKAQTLYQNNVISNKSYDDVFSNTISEMVKKHGTECFKKGGTASNLIADYLPDNEYTKQRRRIKHAIDSGACNYLLESSAEKSIRINGATSILIDYCDMDEKTATETIALLAHILI